MDMITAACAASLTGLTLISPCFNFCHNWPRQVGAEGFGEL